MPTITAGQSAIVSIPAGQAATFPAGPLGRATIPGQAIYNIGPGVVTIGPFQFDRNVDVFANQDLTYTVAAPGGTGYTDERAAAAARAAIPASSFLTPEVAATKTQVAAQGAPIQLNATDPEWSNGAVRLRSSISRAYKGRSASVWFPANLTGPTSAFPAPNTGGSAATMLATSDLSGAAATATNYAKHNATLKITPGTSGGNAFFTWTSGMPASMPADGLLVIPVTFPDWQANSAGTAYLQFTLTNAGGAITYKYSVASLKPGRNNLPVWNPATDAHFAYHAPGEGTAEVLSNTGFNFALPPTSFQIAPGNIPANFPAFTVHPIEAPSQAAFGVLLFSNDYTNYADTFGPGSMTALMEAVGLRMTVRWGGVFSNYISAPYLAGIGAAYLNGHDVHNGTFDRQVSFTSSTAEDIFRRELLQCQAMAADEGLTRGMNMMSGGGNAVASYATTRKVCGELGINMCRAGGGSPINVMTMAGLDDPLFTSTNGMDIGTLTSITTTAASAAGTNKLTLSSLPSTAKMGMSMFGDGIPAGAYVVDVLGSVVTLSAPLTADVPSGQAVSYQVSLLPASLLKLRGLEYTKGFNMCFTHILPDQFAALAAAWAASQAAGKIKVMTASQAGLFLTGR